MRSIGELVKDPAGAVAIGLGLRRRSAGVGEVVRIAWPGKRARVAPNGEADSRQHLLEGMVLNRPVPVFGTSAASRACPPSPSLEPS